MGHPSTRAADATGVQVCRCRRFFSNDRWSLRSRRRTSTLPRMETPESMPSRETSRPIVVDVRDLRKVYATAEHEIAALDGVTLEIPAGSFTAIMGASGSGKSTLLHLVGGLTAPTTGTILIEGHDLGRMSDRARTLFRRRRIGAGRTRAARRPPTRRTLGRRAATRRDRPGPAQRPGHRSGRRADRESRLEAVRGHLAALARHRRAATHHRPDGNPRSPRRRAGRRRDRAQGWPDNRGLAAEGNRRCDTGRNWLPGIGGLGRSALAEPSSPSHWARPRSCG